MDILTILKTKDEGSSKIVVIKYKVSNSSYSVIDKKGRQSVVESSESYLSGQSVIIKNGIILGRTTSVQKYKEYEV